MQVIVRPLTDADIEPARQVQIAAFTGNDETRGRPTPPVTAARAQRQRARLTHFLTHDPAGSWVAEADGAVVGVALALRRGDLWGLSLLVVSPPVQSRGVGRRLLTASLRYADGARRAVILSSQDPRAMRRYAKAGFDLHPQVAAGGCVRSAALPGARSRVREGTPGDAALADAVDEVVRGAPRGSDHDRLVDAFARYVVDDADGRGYAYVHVDGEVVALAATDEATAAALLWRCLAHAHEAGKDAVIEHIAGNQQWAVRTAVAAGLVLRPDGPVFWRGGAPPPSYLPSGAFL